MSTKSADFRRSLQVPVSKIKKLNNKKGQNQGPGIYPGKGNKIIKSEQDIRKMMQEMAQKIYTEYYGYDNTKQDEPLALICVDFGAKDMFNILYDELAKYGIQLYEGHVRTIKDATRKEKERETPEFRYKTGIAEDRNEAILQNMNAIIFDDQVVSGKTAQLLMEYFKNKAKSVEFATAVLTGETYLQQPLLQNIRFVGMKSSQKVFGYRMDHKGQGRDSRNIYFCPKKSRLPKILKNKELKPRKGKIKYNKFKKNFNF